MGVLLRGCSTTSTIRLPIVRTTVRPTARATSATTRRFVRRCWVRRLIKVIRKTIMRSPFQKSQKHQRNHWLLIYRGILLRLKNVKEQCKKIPGRLFGIFYCCFLFIKLLPIAPPTAPVPVAIAPPLTRFDDLFCSSFNFCLSVSLPFIARYNDAYVPF